MHELLHHTNRNWHTPPLLRTLPINLTFNSTWRLVPTQLDTEALHSLVYLTPRTRRLRTGCILLTLGLHSYRNYGVRVHLYTTTFQLFWLWKWRKGNPEEAMPSNRHLWLRLTALPITWHVRVLPTRPSLSLLGYPGLDILPAILPLRVPTNFADMCLRSGATKQTNKQTICSMKYVVCIMCKYVLFGI